MAHRIIDYRRLDKECGIAIVSIDEDFLQNVCQNFTQDGRVFDFIVDDRGRIISFGDAADKIGIVVADVNLNEDDRLDEYRNFLKDSNVYSRTTSNVYLYHDDTLQWDIVSVSDQSGLIIAQRRQLFLIIMLGLVAMVATVIFSTGMSRQSISSVRKIVEGMRMAQSGDLSVRVEKYETMPLEIESIADGFNDMFDKLRHAIDRQQQAQVAALESQINPHFLYNTLDTINWMAIDKEEYDISNAISALANILRYAIVNSNAEVKVQDEVDWLKKYVYLQQYRVKGSFSCNISVEPETQNASIHKLLLQPFIENAIVHGFDKNQNQAIISVSIARDGNLLSVEISDNGKGMDPGKMDEINKGIIEQDSNNGIGIKNVITRMEMYYGNEASIEAKGSYPMGTCITIKLPYSEK